MRHTNTISGKLVAPRRARARAFTVKLLIFFAIALAAPRAWAQDGVRGAMAPASQRPKYPVTPFVQTLAVADFDNDHKLDGAILLDSGRALGWSSFRIQFHFSGTDNTELAFQSTESQLSIRALDINHDGATDVVIEHPVTHKRLYVWLNDGHGVFRKADVQDYPSAEPPRGRQLERPSFGTEQPVCIPQQRGAGMTLLASSSTRGRPPSGVELRPLASSASARSIWFSFASSRAPPSTSSSFPLTWTT